MIVATRQMTVTRQSTVLHRVVVPPTTAVPPLCLMPPNLTLVLLIIATAMLTHHLHNIILQIGNLHTRPKRPSLIRRLIYLSVLTRKADS